MFLLVVLRATSRTFHRQTCTVGQTILLKTFLMKRLRAVGYVLRLHNSDFVEGVFVRRVCLLLIRSKRLLPFLLWVHVSVSAAEGLTASKGATAGHPGNHTACSFSVISELHVGPVVLLCSHIQPKQLCGEHGCPETRCSKER